MAENMADTAAYAVDGASLVADVIEEEVARAARVLKDASAVFVATGAGMSVDSGLPDYRGEGGVWSSDARAEALYGVSTDDRARAGSWFQKDPTAAWGDFLTSADVYATAAPHVGYDFLADLAKGKPCFVVTSNVDGMHTRSGAPEASVYAVHGTYFGRGGTATVRAQCSFHGADACPTKGDPDGVREFDRTTFALGPETGRADKKRLPTCMGCFKPMRPNVLFFQDKCAAMEHISFTPERDRMQDFLKEHGGDNARLVVLEIGVGDHIRTVRNRAHKTAQTAAAAAGGTATLVRVNLHQAAFTEVDRAAMPALFEADACVSIPLRAAEALRLIRTAMMAL